NGQRGWHVYLLGNSAFGSYRYCALIAAGTQRELGEDDRAAKGAAGLVPPMDGCHSIEEAAGIEDLVPEELIHFAVQLVGARFQNIPLHAAPEFPYSAA